MHMKDARNHVSVPMIEHELDETMLKVDLPSYVQFSSHDSQMGNVWAWLEPDADWYYIPYASYLHIELSRDDLCIEKHLYALRDKIKADQYFNYENGFTDSLFTSAQRDELQ